MGKFFELKNDGLLNKLLFTVAGVFVGFFIYFFSASSTSDSSCVYRFDFIKKNLNCDVYDVKGVQLNSLQNKLEVLISGFKKTGKANRVSVFVRDLTTTRFVGIDDSDEYVMASLLKVPLVVGAYKLAEVEPKILDQSISYGGQFSVDTNAYIKPKETVQKGRSYTIRELVERAIIYSDNVAAQMLFDYYQPGFLDRIVQALGLDIHTNDLQSENPVTARRYANVFRSLYNSSYLTKEYSNEILSLLARTDYHNGAVAKLPQHVNVAHKFGERTFYAAEKEAPIRQLHDCGLVYAKDGKEPYTFCIMTEGVKFEDLEGVLQEISLIVYNGLVE